MDKNLERVRTQILGEFKSGHVPDRYMLRRDVFKWYKNLANKYNTSVYGLLGILKIHITFDIFGGHSLANRLKLFEYNGVIDLQEVSKSGTTSNLIAYVKWTGETVVQYIERQGYIVKNLECCRLPTFTMGA